MARTVSGQVGRAALRICSLNRKWIAALKVAGHDAAIAKPRLQHPEAATGLAQFLAMSPGMNRAAKG
jgi:hypothetical protein